MSQTNIDAVTTLVNGSGQGVEMVDTIKDGVTGSPGQASLGALQSALNFIEMAGKLNPEIALLSGGTISLTQLELKIRDAMNKEGKLTDGELISIAADLTSAVTALSVAIGTAQAVYGTAITGSAVFLAASAIIAESGLILAAAAFTTVGLTAWALIQSPGDTTIRDSYANLLDKTQAAIVQGGDSVKDFFAEMGGSVEEGIQNFAAYSSERAEGLAKLYQQYLEDSVRDGAQALSDYIANVVKAVQDFVAESPTNPYTWNDSNGNGLLNENDPDMDGDWILNDRDPDKDGDGILNEDDEHAQDPRTLNDIDGDSIANEDDNDIDGDGAKNYEDEDIDNDGQKNDVDPNDFDPRTPDDIDGDGIKDWNDPDRDGDKIPNELDDHPDDIENQPRGNPSSVDPGAYGISPPPPTPLGAKDNMPNSNYNGTPIILDLDGDGVETRSSSEGIQFDLDNNGFRETVGWVGADDGLLVLDKNDDGQITGGNELFGNNTLLASGNMAANGFIALAEFDDNMDSRIDENDAVFSQLKIWRDLDADGVSDTGELMGLAEADVARLNLANTYSTTTDVQGNQHRQIGTYVDTSGTTHGMVDVWFDVDPTRTKPVAEISIPTDIMALPNANGSGSVRNLHESMVLDTSGKLRQLVEQFVAETDSEVRTALLPKLMFQWVGGKLAHQDDGYFVDGWAVFRGQHT